MHGSLSSWSDIIDNLLVKDFLTLKLRIGAGTDTICIFAPVVCAANILKSKYS